LEPYWGKPAVRNLRGNDGNLGIIRSPVRAIVLPDRQRVPLRSAIALTDSAGTIHTQYTYEPFSKMTASGQANANPYQFTGRENDGTGLYFYRACYYRPSRDSLLKIQLVSAAGPELLRLCRRVPLGFRDETGEGVGAAIVVGGACFAYAAYSHYSNLAELNQLSRIDSP
jgi:RHS repeat-associated protein